MRKDEETAPVAPVHVNVEKPPVPKEEEGPASLGKRPGTTKELCKATGYTMNVVGAIQESDGKDTGDSDTIKYFGVACANLQVEANKWRTQTHGGRKPVVK